MDQLQVPWERTSCCFKKNEKETNEQKKSQRKRSGPPGPVPRCVGIHIPYEFIPYSTSVVFFQSTSGLILIFNQFFPLFFSIFSRYSRFVLVSAAISPLLARSPLGPGSYSACGIQRWTPPSLPPAPSPPPPPQKPPKKTPKTSEDWISTSCITGRTDSCRNVSVPRSYTEDKW